MVLYDGNGWVGRLLSPISLLECGLHSIHTMGSGMLDASKEEYFDALVL